MVTPHHCARPLRDVDAGSCARSENRSLRRARGILCCLIAVLAASCLATPALASNYYLEIKKTARMLLVKNGEHIEKKFNISLGRGGHGDKHRSGDNRTPVGTYRIVTFNNNSKFHYFMQLNYPNVKDAFYGLKSNVISRSDFDRIIDALRHGGLPPQNTRLGGAIGIHGIGDETDEKLRIHNALDWTEGCIALTNHDVQELRRYVTVGTRVVISE